MRERKLRLNSTGAAEVFIILGLVIASLIVSGLFFTINNPGSPSSPITISGGPGSCCDTADCTPISDPAHLLTYNGSQYGLLKSNVNLREGGNHLKDSNQQFNGHPIILNVTDGFVQKNGQYECGKGTKDQIWNVNGTPKCFAIPNDEILYVCTAGCVPGNCANTGKNNSCYGNKTTVFDIYFRLSDLPNPGIPQPIKDCQGVGVGGNIVVDQTNPTIVISPYNSHSSEQLHTFGFITPTPYPAGSTPWISPYCKPVIYLYPPADEKVHVAITPKGILAKTIPPYPPAGWDVLAHTDGTVTVNNQTYPYLYYEAKIPDNELPVNTKTGYVSSYADLSTLFTSLLPQLGLNATEASAFSTYWLHALPHAPYYFISIVPQDVLDFISPLSISPTPDSILRVTLHFEPLDHPIPVSSPVLSSVKRGKFHITEWGGLVKRTDKYPFTCLE